MARQNRDYMKKIKANKGLAQAKYKARVKKFTEIKK